MNTQKTSKTLDLAYIAMFAALIAVCSWISIPATVPFTMQTFGVFLAVGLLGGKRGTLAVLVYIVLGIVGLPVFAGFKGGAAALLGNTGGYIVGFLFSALLMWVLERAAGRRTGILAVSMLAGLLVCYAFGTAWFMLFYAHSTGEIGVMTALGWCVFPYILPDLLKIGLALLLCKKLSPLVRQPSAA